MSPPGSSLLRPFRAPARRRSRAERPFGAGGSVSKAILRESDVPELPEVDALVQFLRERLVGRAVDRVDIGAISVLKTYDPPPTALSGLTVTAVERHGKFLDVDVDGVHLVFHLARAGWLR